MRKLLLLLLVPFLLIPAGAGAQTTREAVIEKVARANQVDKTLSFSFTRTRHTAMATRDLVSEGKMSFISPDRLRWEITGPVKSLFILSGQSVLSESSRGRKVTDLTTDRRFQSIARNIGRVAAGSPINEKDFKIEVLTAEKELTLKMIPLRRDLAGLFDEILLTADATTGLAKQIILRDPTGDTTTLQLRDIRKNGEIDSGLFEFQR